MSSQREIRLNAFDMNCVGHQSPGLWAHPRDRSWQYKDLEYWVDLARLLERGKFDGLFIADVLGVCDAERQRRCGDPPGGAGAGQRSAGADYADGAGDGASGIRPDRFALFLSIPIRSPAVFQPSTI